MKKRIKDIEARLSAIKGEAAKDDADIDALTKEAGDLQEERTGLLNQIEKRQKLLDSISNGSEGQITRIFDDGSEPRKYTAESPEYRSAFFKNLLGKELATEERAAFTHLTTNTAAVLPTTTLNQIWDLVSGQHSIMKDIKVLKTGTVIKVAKHVSILQGKAKKVAEGVANDDEQNEFIDVTLTGNDFSKHINVSYAMAQMSIDALEAYLVSELSEQLGEAMADDAVATIITGINAANKVETAAVATVTYKELAGVFGKLKRARDIKVYVTNATLYNRLVAMTDDTGRPIFQSNMQDGAKGALLGGLIRIEDSVGDDKILIGDPNRVLFNMVQDIMIERDKDIKNHVYTYAGYARGEGALMDDKSFALLTVKPTV
ncbi:phage major capsid protein [Oscillospiraceae bacterium LTW-04]|nr:phage major capsid protein [Oscillospiraceae bacterium MB24-C1]